MPPGASCATAGTDFDGGHAHMVKCPFCGFDNEDGALFCEQCKSDLSMVPVPAPAAAPAAPAPAPEPVPMAAILEDTIPMAPMVEPAPVGAPIAADATIPMAAPIGE